MQRELPFEPFRILSSRTMVLPQENIDTDQIIPARFLATTQRHGLGELAFYDWRRDAEGAARPDHVLNRLDPAGHRILVAGRNFGCGSSREHAPWALVDYGFRAVVSSEIAEIFAANALNNGLLPVVIDEKTHRLLLERPGAEVVIDLEQECLRLGTHQAAFKVDSFARACLLQGADSLGWLLTAEPDIARFEVQRNHLRETEATA